MACSGSNPNTGYQQCTGVQSLRCSNKPRGDSSGGGMAMQGTHHTAVVNGLHIHYVTHGQGAPVILLHGWPEFWYSWRKQIPVLGERFEVIVPDMRGFGYSDKPHTGYDTRTAASDIYALARGLGHPRVSLVAHDIGARVAYRFTLDHEETVERLALLDATPPHERYGPQMPPVVRERWHAYFHQQGDLPGKADRRARGDLSDRRTLFWEFWRL